MFTHHLRIPLGGQSPQEYAHQLDEAVSELFRLLFERRILDLQEPQCYALYTLADLQIKLRRCGE